MPEETFKSEGAYQRWNAYRHIHGIAAPHLKTVCIKGHGCRKVNHGIGIKSGKGASGRTAKFTGKKKSSKRQGK